MAIPVKACVGRFSDETIDLLIKNVDRAQWLPQLCEQCRQQVGARLEKGRWVPEPHWPSVPQRQSRRTAAGDTRPRRGEPRAKMAKTTTLPVPEEVYASTAIESTGATPKRWQKILDGGDNSVSEKDKNGPEKAKPARETPGQTRVFVVDDEFIISSTLTLILRHHGFDATSFTGPLDALEAAAVRPPDVLVSDVNMPQLSGIDLAIRVRELAPDCKILLFSGADTTAELAETARADGYAFEILSRPLHPVDLLKRVLEITAHVSDLTSVPE